MSDAGQSERKSPFEPTGRVASIPLGIVVQRQPGATRWAPWVWKATSVMPGAGPADWSVLREHGDTVEFHAKTIALELHRSEVEAYRVSLTMDPPAVFVVLREEDDASSNRDYAIHAVTASAYEAQDYLDSGEEIVEAVPMPPGLIAWVREFTDVHYIDEPFVKRKRDKKRVDLSEDGIGDARIRQKADVYRAPGAQKPRRAQ
ncbi:MAG: DUF3305 domain-containing protein [Rhodobacteraceae bacterium]|nr:DUF3305 domain-containing protein [Paracoccaceae bacterium]